MTPPADGGTFVPLLRRTRPLGEHDPSDPDLLSDPALYLAGLLRGRLRAAAERGGSPAWLVEGARACGDLATLVACNPHLLPPGEALAAAREAASAVRSLRDGGPGEGEPAGRDLRSALWRAEIAVRQLEAGRPTA